MVFVCVASRSLAADDSDRPVTALPAHLEILQTVTLPVDELPGPSIAIDGADGTSLWLAASPQEENGSVMRIDRHMALQPISNNVPISGYITSGIGVTAAVPAYNSVLVWRPNRLSSDRYNVPTNDDRSSLEEFDELRVDFAGDLWLRRLRRGRPLDSPLLFVLRPSDKQFVPVALPDKAQVVLRCDKVFVQTNTTAYEILADTLEVRQVSVAPCGWSSDPYGVTHFRRDGTSKRLQLVDPFSSGLKHIMPPLILFVGPTGDAWVWTKSLCRIGVDERVFCAPVDRRFSPIAFARNGTLWLVSADQTLVHAKFIVDQ